MKDLIDLLSRDRVHIFGPRNYDTRLHLTYKMVCQAIQNGAEIIGFEIEPEKLIWHKQGEAHESVIEMTKWEGSYAKSWRKILGYDKEVAKFFEVIEDSQNRIVCRIINVIPFD